MKSQSNNIRQEFIIKEGSSPFFYYELLHTVMSQNHWMIASYCIAGYTEILIDVKPADFTVSLMSTKF